MSPIIVVGGVFLGTFPFSTYHNRMSLVTTIAADFPLLLLVSWLVVLIVVLAEVSCHDLCLETGTVHHEMLNATASETFGFVMAGNAGSPSGSSFDRSWVTKPCRLFMPSWPS